MEKTFCDYCEKEIGELLVQVEPPNNYTGSVASVRLPRVLIYCKDDDEPERLLKEDTLDICAECLAALLQKASNK